MAETTIQQAFELAVQHHQAGELHEAEVLYRQILARQPGHAGALHHLGVLASQVGQNAAAVELIRRALALVPDWPEANSNLGAILEAGGTLDQAIAAYRRAIALQPTCAQTHNNLGNTLKAAGLLDEAIAAYRHAIVLLPGYPEAHNNLGNALRANGQMEQALVAYRQALVLKPDYPEAHNNLGTALQDEGQMDEAIGAFRQALALKPHLAQAHNNLGNALKDKGQLGDAIAALRQAVVLKPDFAEAYSNLGNALQAKGQLDEAIAACRLAIALKPNLPEAHNNLGNALKDKGLLDEAIASFGRVLALQPDFAQAHNNLGIALRDQGRLDEAIAAWRRAIALKPHYPEAHNNLGNALKDRGQLDDAIAAWRQALALMPNFIGAHSSLVFHLQYHPAFDAIAIAQEQRRWNQQHAEPLGSYAQPHPNDRDPGRRLRIGYVSPDLREHVVGRNLLPLLATHDKSLFEVFAFAEVRAPDTRTQQLRGYIDHWRSSVGLSDQQLADQIRQDRIDILVDLALHTAGNRLLVFARKPAPVQVTFAGYPGSTGLPAIDYRLSDPYLDPPGMDESVYSEQTVRLPHSFWCYDPLDERDIPVNALPVLQSGEVTLGCLNSIFKINEQVLSLWARVLQEVANSRLLLLAPEGEHRQRMRERLRQEGIAPARVEFAPSQSRRGYVELYRRIDMGLDSFPYNGHTTSLDSFWMGVPVITLVGQTAVARAGWCQLSNLGLTELAAHTPDQFVKIAVALAHDLPRLQELRKSLRQRMQASPLMDGKRFARGIEAAYRQMWQTWCATTG